MVNLAKLGAQVIVTERSEEKIKAVVEECLQISTASGEVKVLPVVADLQKDSYVQNLIDETIKTYNKLDVLVNNAGTIVSARVTDDNSMDVFDGVFDTNVRGVLRLTKLAVPHLFQSKEANINIYSCLSMKPRPREIAYCSSKAALDTITRCLCNELSLQGICVDTVNPTIIETPIFERSGRNLETIKKRVSTLYPMQRVGKVSDTTAACLYLASDDACFITGINLPVDGGFLNAANYI